MRRRKQAHGFRKKMKEKQALHRRNFPVNRFVVVRLFTEQLNFAFQTKAHLQERLTRRD